MRATPASTLTTPAGIALHALPVRRSRSFPAALRGAALLAGAFIALSAAGTPPAHGIPEGVPDPEQAKSAADILSAVVTVHVETVNHARGLAATPGRERRGTGVVVEPGDVVLTSAALVQEADAIVITTFDSRTVLAAVAALDPAHGTAVLRPAAALGVRALPVGRAVALAPRSPVSVAAAARGHAIAVATVLDKRDIAAEHELLVEGAIVTAPLLQECAGAALVDGNGRLVGVGIGSLSSRGVGNVFIPVERFLPGLSHLLRADGSRAPRRPWLGLVTERTVAGLVVKHVPPGSPAARAGLRVGDVVRAVNGRTADSHAELYRAIWHTGGPGTSIRLLIERDGAAAELRMRTIDPEDYLIHRA